MELQNFLEKNNAFKAEVTKLASEFRKDNLPEEFYRHAVKSVVEKYSADFSRRTRNLVDPDSIAEISVIASQAAIRTALMDSGATMDAGAPPRMSEDEIRATIEQYFQEHPEELPEGERGEMNGEPVYHDVESDEVSEQPTQMIDGDAPDVSNINVPRPTAY